MWAGTYEFENSMNEHFIHTSQSTRLFRQEFGLAERSPAAVTYTHLPAGAVMESRPLSVAPLTIRRSVGFHEGNMFVTFGSVKKPEALPRPDDQK